MKLPGLNIQSNVATQPLSFSPLKKGVFTAISTTRAKTDLPYFKANDFICFFRVSVISLICGINDPLTLELK